MATSPPTPTNLTIPTSKKRPSLGPPSQSTTTQGYISQAAKRPKLQHPLRQTSFPSNEAQAALYTPTAPRSETGSISASLVSGFSGTTGGKRSRGRPKKRKSQPQDIQSSRHGGDYNDDGNSAILDGKDTDTHTSPRSRPRRGGTKSVVSGANGPPADDPNAAEDDDDTNAALLDPDSEESRRLQAELAQEKERIAQLQEALTPEQMQRYTCYLRTKLKSSTLKRIINQTVSQSVTTNPLSAVQWVGKVFVGEIVEGAREVQEEWADGWEVARWEKWWEREVRERRRRRRMTMMTRIQGGVDRDGDEDGKEGEESENENDLEEKSPNSPIVKPTADLYSGANPHRGGLLPDHLREAVRRYKSNGEGGGVGFGGFSFAGLALKGEAVPRLGMGSANGRRLFR